MKGGCLKPVGSTLIWLMLLFTGCGADQESTDARTESLEFGSEQSVDILTWNIEAFPKEGFASAEALVDLLTALQPDVVAIQEVWSQAHLEWVAQTLGTFQISATPESEATGLYFLFDTRTAELVTPAQTILRANAYDFGSRAPIQIDLMVHGTSIRLINLHYKCCGDDQIGDTYWDEEVRRLRASGVLKGYLDRLSSSSPVVVLGDWNDALTDPDPQNVFRPFEEDSTHYQFADLDIAQPENQQSWSFPSYPSHLDHILVNRPLIPVLNQDSTLVRTIRVDQASGPGTHDYFQTLSDHRPVGLSFRVESTSVRR